MATGGAPTRKEVDRHTCSLCMKPYRGRSPEILPYFHTICPERENRRTEDEDQKQPDSNSDERKRQNKTSERDDVTNYRSDDVEKSVFLCPTCRDPVSIPEGGSGRSAGKMLGILYVKLYFKNLSQKSAPPTPTPHAHILFNAMRCLLCQWLGSSYFFRYWLVSCK